MPMPMPMPCPFAQEPRLRNTLPVSGTPAEANAMVIGYDRILQCIPWKPGNLSKPHSQHVDEVTSTANYMTKDRENKL